MPQFMFKCPHCGAQNSVPLEEIGAAAACSDCGLPFMANAPAANLLQREGDQWVVARGSASVKEKNQALHNDEQSLLSINPATFREHPIQTPLFTLFIIAGITMAVYFGTGENTSAGTIALAVVGAVLAFICIAVFTLRFVGSRFESLTITNQRSIWARGIINRQTSEVQHDDIRNIQVSQTLLERLVGAGTIAISSAGQGDMEIVIKGIAHPRTIVETVRTYQRKMVKGD